MKLEEAQKEGTRMKGWFPFRLVHLIETEKGSDNFIVSVKKTNRSANDALRKGLAVYEVKSH